MTDPISTHLPVEGDPPPFLLPILEAGAAAPSSHNSQPWLFRVTKAGAIEVHADISRGLPVVDPDDRELVISCGAALQNMRVALRAAGWTDEIEIVADLKGTGHLATLTPGAKHTPTERETALADAIALRRTVRSRFEPEVPPLALIEQLLESVEEEACWLRIIADADREELAVLVGAGDRTQMQLKSFRRELAAWMRPNHSKRLDGMPGFTMGFGELMSAIGPVVVRTFDLGKSQAARDEELVLHSPLLLVLGTTRDDPTSWMQAGMALERVLLELAAEGWFASFLNQAVEVGLLRSDLATLVGEPRGFPQIVLRVGRAAPGKAPPRRDVDDMLIEE